MKGNWKLILKNGKVKRFNYYTNAVKAYWKEYGFDVRNIDNYVIAG